MATSNDWNKIFGGGATPFTEKQVETAKKQNEASRYAQARESVLRPLREKVALEQPDLAMKHPELARIPTRGPERITAIKNTQGKLGTGGSGEIFEGGTMSDIIDALTVLQYGTTGLFDPRVSVSDAIKYRYAPSEALGQSGPVGLGLDIVLDPLNFVGIGGLSKLGKAAKAGKAVEEGGKIVEAGVKGAKALEEAGTLAGAVRAGEKGLVTAKLPGMKGSVSLLPKFVERPVADLITKGVQNLKRIGVEDKNLGNVLSGIFGTLKTAPKELKGIDDLERFIKSSKEGSELAKRLSRLGEVENVRALDKIKPIVKAMGRSSLGAEESLALQKKLFSYGTKTADNIKLTKKAENIFQKIRPLMEESIEGFKKTGIRGGQEGKVLPLVPTARGEKTLQELTPGKLLNRKESIGRFGSTFKLGDDIVYARTPTAAKGIKTGKEYVEIDGKWYKVGDSKEIKSLKDKIKEQRQEFDILKKSGVDNDILNVKSRDIDRMVTKLAEKLRGDGVELTRKAVTPMEANAAFGKQVFKEDAVESLYAKLSQTGRINKRKEFILQAAEKFGKPIRKGEVIPAGYREVKGIDDLKGFAFERPIAEALETVYEPFTKLDSVSGFLDAYDKALNFWKKTATYINPAFHTRNMVSNHWQMWLAGVRNPFDMVKGYETMAKIPIARRTSKSIEKAIGPKELGYYKEFVEDGLGGTGYFTGDIKQTLKPQNLWFEGGSKAGAFLEDSAKYAVYRAKRKAGWAPEKASAHVRKFMFDYSELTPFEQKVMKRFIPFYTWQRKNIPLQVAMLIDQPTAFSAVGKAKRAIESTREGEPMDERLLPEWMRDGYSIWFGQNSDGTQNYLNLEGFLPAVDLAKIGRPQEIPIEGLSPLLKTPLELLTNYDTFYEEQIQQYGGQTKEYFGQQIPIGLEHVLRTIRPASELEKVLGLNYQTKNLSPAERLMKLGIGTPLRNIDEMKERWKAYYSLSDEIKSIDRDLSIAEKSGSRENADRLIGMKLQRKEEMANILAQGLLTAQRNNNVGDEVSIKKSIRFMKTGDRSEIKEALEEAKAVGNQAIIDELEKNKGILDEEIKSLNKDIKDLEASSTTSG